jgi:hypothetical protein
VSNGQSSAGRAVASVLLYVVAHEFPIVVALLFALVIAMPLGMWLFAPLRRRATAGLEEATARRRHDREQLQARLRGEEPPASD